MDYSLRFVDQLRPHLKALRKKRGLTQAQAGALVGVSQARIAEIEANPGAVSLEQLTKLLSTLGATFFLREETPSSGVQYAMEEPSKKYEPLQDTVVNLPAGPWTTRKMSGPSVLVTLTPAEDGPVQSTSQGALLRQLQALNPDKDVKPTSRRSFVVRPKMGSW
jgi:HTH-type transcriptional regulator/antitoxin HipB